MKCISCEVDINPKWKHAIDMNVCPFCGKHIMEEHLKNLLGSLAETMEQLKEYPDQLNDWLLSNYGFIKTDSPDLPSYLPEDYLKDYVREAKKIENEKDFLEKKMYTVKVKTEKGEEEVIVEKTQSEEKTNGFFQRAEAINQVAKDGPKSISEKTAHLKQLKKKIETEASQGIVNETGLAAMISPDMLSKANPEEVAAYQTLISSEDEVMSSLPESSNGDDDEIPPVVLAMASRGKNNNKNNEAADIAKLQQMHARIKNSRVNFESGENRGGKGGGFSRA